MPPPLVPPVAKSYSRQRHAAGQGDTQRSASFHGRTAEQRHLLKQKPKTQPDLLAGIRRRNYWSMDAGDPPTRKMPSKVPMSVAVRQSMWPLHVMASTEWSVADLVAAAVNLYVKEGRRPLLPSTDPSSLGLHYSQFSLECLDPKQKLMELGSRSFFLCPKSPATAATPSTWCSTQANKAASRTATTLPWLRFMHFWPLL